MLERFKKMIQVFFLVITIVFLSLNLLYWHFQWLGLVTLIIYLIIVGDWWSIALRRVIQNRINDLIIKLFGIFVAYSTLTMLTSVWVALYKITDNFLLLTFVVGGLMALGAEYLTKKTKQREQQVDDWNIPRRFYAFEGRAVYLVLYLIFWLYGLILLIKSESVQAIFSPWQTIGTNFFLVFFVLSILLGIMLLSKYRTKTLIVLVIFHSLLLHFYLPLSHQLPWGGDVWRHLANAKRVESSEIIHPALFDEAGKIETKEVLGMVLPALLVQPQKLSYSQLWGSGVMLRKILMVDLENIMKWQGPIVWGLFAPIIFFYLGVILFRSPQWGLWFSAFALVPFTFQAMGGFSLPVTFGYLFFFFILMLWLFYLRNHLRVQKRMAIFFSILAIFGYGLHFILIWWVILASWAIKLILKIQRSIVRKSVAVIFAFSSIFLIPVIELLGKISYVPEKIDLLKNLKQLVGQFSGWYLASAIRPGDILSGNIFFNHTPDYAFVANFISEWRWPVLLMMLVIWILVLIGLISILKNRGKIINGLMGVLFLTTGGGYIIGWFVLEGDRLLVRRLDGMMAFVVIILIMYGIEFISRKLEFINTENKNKIKTKIFSIFLILLLAWFLMLCFTSGPDIRVASIDEYYSAKNIWNNEKQNQTNFCVIGDTWPLLVLEGISGGKIVGGGFPIDYQFVQPELKVIYNEFLLNPRQAVLDLAKIKTGASNCAIILPRDKISVNHDKFFADNGEKVEYFGGIAVWREGLK